MVSMKLIEGSLEAKLPTIWTDEKQSREEAERRERLEERRSEKRKSQKKEDADARKGRNVVKHWKSRFPVFFQWFVAPEGGKVGSLKRRVRRQLARWEMRKCTPLWREAHFQVKMYKTHQVRTTFGSCDVEKVHAVVARSTCPSQNVQNTTWSDHFWKLRCRKSARRCGAKHISKWKCTKHHLVGPLLEVAMSKKCTPLWREAHFQVKMYKTLHVRTTFGGSDVDFRKSARRCGAKHMSKSKCTKHHMVGPLLEVAMSKKCTPLWREAHFQVKMYKTLHVRTTFGGSDVDFRKSARRCGAKHISKSRCTKHTILGPLLEVEMLKKCTPLWREAHFQVKSVKNWRSRTTFWSSDVEKVSKKSTPLWREAHFEVKSVKNWGFWAFFDVKMSKK